MFEEAFVVPPFFSYKFKIGIMKAKELVKKAKTIEEIYSQIRQASDNGEFKTFLHHCVFVSDETKLQLSADGFKVYNGDWDGVMTNVFIIEW